MDALNRLLGRLADWLEKVLPTALTLGGAVYYWMLGKLKAEEKAHDKTKLQKELVENELAVERDFANRSNADVIKRASKLPRD